VAKAVFIGLIVLLCVTLGLLYSSYKKRSMTPEEVFAKEGGLRLVLEIEDADIKTGQRGLVLEKMAQIITNRVNQLGVHKALIEREGDNLIVVQLPGIEDAERAKKIVARQALLEFRLVCESRDLTRALENLDVVLRDVRSGEEEAVTSKESVRTEEEAANNGGLLSQDSAGTDTAISVKTRGDSILDEMLAPLAEYEKEATPPGVFREENPFTSYLLQAYGGGVIVEDKNIERVEALLSTSEAEQVIPSRFEFLWSIESLPFAGGAKGKILYLVEKKAELTGAAIIDAETRPDPYLPSELNVLITLDREGGLILRKITALNIGRAFAIVLDGVVRSAPIIQTEIPGGQAQISGMDLEEEANDLSIVLRSGSLPAGIRIKEEHIIAPAR
jgi:preprotein translocase subunit SecD